MFALSPATIAYLGTSCETFSHNQHNFQRGKFFFFFYLFSHTNFQHIQQKKKIMPQGFFCPSFLPNWTHQYVSTSIIRFPHCTPTSMWGSLIREIRMANKKSKSENKKRSYHRSAADERKWTNMAKLMNNNSTSSVSIVLHLKHLDQVLVRLWMWNITMWNDVIKTHFRNNMTS